MDVIQTGRAAFEVSSESEEIPHLTDLEAHGGAIECSCSDWKYRCYPAIRKAQILENHTLVFSGSNRNVCKHGVASIDYILKQNAKLNHVKQV